MTPEQYLTVARQCGATVYTNRHYPLRPAVSFSYPAWLKFCERLEKPAPDALSVVTDDPCPGCKPGTACRTPSCGRMVLFPGHIVHSVAPAKVVKPRVSIAVNFGVEYV